MIFGHCVCSTSANIIYSITLGNKESKTRTADTKLDRQMVTVKDMQTIAEETKDKREKAC